MELHRWTKATRLLEEKHEALIFYKLSREECVARTRHRQQSYNSYMMVCSAISILHPPTVRHDEHE